MPKYKVRWTATVKGCSEYTADSIDEVYDQFAADDIDCSDHDESLQDVEVDDVEEIEDE